MKTVKVFLALTIAVFTLLATSCEMSVPFGGSMPAPPNTSVPSVTGEEVVTTQFADTTVETTAQTASETEAVVTEAPKKEIPPEYLSLIDTIKLGINNDWGFEEFEKQGISYLAAYASTPSEISYALYDLDSNGTDELIIRDGAGGILNVFAMYGGRAEPVICGFERSTYTLCEDGYIINSGTDSADAGSYSVILMKDGYLNTLQYFYYEYIYWDNYTTLKCYFGTNAYSIDEMSEISEESMYEALDKYKLLELEYTPLG